MNLNYARPASRVDPNKPLRIWRDAKSIVVGAVLRGSGCTPDQDRSRPLTGPEKPTLPVEK